MLRWIRFRILSLPTTHTRLPADTRPCHGDLLFGAACDSTASSRATMSRRLLHRAFARSNTTRVR